MVGGRAFYKMSGSGNDFVVVDARAEPAGRLAEPATIRAICARGTGVGADGIVFLEHSNEGAIKLVYRNADASPAALCGNATLCAARLAVELGAGKPAGFRIETEAGLVEARILESGLPEFDFQPVRDVRTEVPGIERAPGERQAGFAIAGVPHLVILRDEVGSVDVVSRGRDLRRHAELGSGGANVNFVAPAGLGRWEIRSYERGVEGETLACGTGAVASAVLLNAWNLASDHVTQLTPLGKELGVCLVKSSGSYLPSLSGEARLVFEGKLPADA